MHEARLCLSLIRLAEEALASDGGRHIVSVDLEVGELSGVAPEALAAAFPVCVHGTSAEGATLRPSIRNRASAPIAEPIEASTCLLLISTDRSATAGRASPILIEPCGQASTQFQQGMHSLRIQLWLLCGSQAPSQFFAQLMQPVQVFWSTWRRKSEKREKRPSRAPRGQR